MKSIIREICNLVDPFVAILILLTALASRLISRLLSFLISLIPRKPANAPRVLLQYDQRRKAQRQLPPPLPTTINHRN